MVKDMEMLVLADMIYERFKSDDVKKGVLKKVFLEHTFLDPLRKYRWEALSLEKKMDGWTLIDAFDLDTYLTTVTEEDKKIPVRKDKRLQREGFYAAAFQKGDDIVIAYRGTDGDNGTNDSGAKAGDADIDWANEHLYTNTKIAAGIPSEQFKMAEWYYKSIKKNHTNSNINFTGHSLGGGLAQYAQLMSEEKNNKMDSWNGIGIAGFSKINGTEFFGYETAFFGNLNVNGDRTKSRYYNLMIDEKYLVNEKPTSKLVDGNGYVKIEELKKIYLGVELLDCKERVNDIKAILVGQNLTDFFDYSITDEDFRKKLQNSIIGTVNRNLNVSETNLIELTMEQRPKYSLSKNWNEIKEILDNKIEFAKKMEEKKDFTNSSNYTISNDFTGNILAHACKQIKLRNEDKFDEADSTNMTSNWKGATDKSKNFVAYHGLDSIYPFIDDNGNMTKKLNPKYLSAVVRKIIDDKIKDEDIQLVNEAFSLNGNVKGLYDRVISELKAEEETSLSKTTGKAESYKNIFALRYVILSNLKESDMKSYLKMWKDGEMPSTIDGTKNYANFYDTLLYREKFMKAYYNDDAPFKLKTTAEKIEFQNANHTIFGNDIDSTINTGDISTRVWGGSKKDKITGGKGNDSLFGGKGDDILSGGAGEDIYGFKVGDNSDTIIDSDGKGKIIIENIVIGKKLKLIKQNVYTEEVCYNLNNKMEITYTVDQKKLLINYGNQSSITINNFSDGMLGINLKPNGITTLTEKELKTTLKSENASFFAYTKDNILELSKYPISSMGESDGMSSGSGSGELSGELLKTDFNTSQDRIFASNEAEDIVYGTIGNDSVDVQGGNNIAFGGAGNDTLIASNSSIESYGEMNNILFGESGSNTLTGGIGDDYLFSGTTADGSNTLSGGEGDDTYVVSGANDLIDDTIGTNKIVFEGRVLGGELTKVEGVENTFKDADGLIYTFNETTNELVLSKDSKIVKIENFEQEAFGISFDNYAEEDLGDSDISDLTTDDTSADDTTTEDASSDTTTDPIIPEDTTILTGAMDNDVIFAKSDTADIYGDGGNDLIYGNDNANTIEGEYGSDIMYGKGGDDTLKGGSDGSSDIFVGGKGNDKLVGSEGNDIYVFEKGDGNDRIIDGRGVNRIKIGDDVLFGTLVREYTVSDFTNYEQTGEFFRLFREGKKVNDYLFRVNQGVLTVYYGDKSNPDSISAEGFQNGQFGFVNLKGILNVQPIAMQQIGASFAIARREGLNGYIKLITAVAHNVLGGDIGLNLGGCRSYLYSLPFIGAGIRMADVASGMDPLVLDLDNDGIETTKLSEGAYFDLDNTTFAEKAGWIKGDDGILVLDKNRDNQITSGDELFGDHTRKKDGTIAKTGYEALADYDDNKDGVIDSKDAIYGEMRVWQDKNSDGVSQAGELSTLEQTGVKSVNLTNTDINEVDAQGNTLARSGSFEKTNGMQGIAGEYLLARDPIDRRALEQQVSDEIKGLLDVQGKGNMDSLQQAMEKDF